MLEFAKDGKYEETVAALSLLCGVPIEVVDRLMAGDRPDPILILCKAAGCGWPTARAIILARPSAQGHLRARASTPPIANFERLSPSTAQRVVRFWQMRPASRGRQRASDGVGSLYHLAGKSDSTARGPRASPWPRSACR